MSQSLSIYDTRDRILGHFTHGCHEGKSLKDIKESLFADRGIINMQWQFEHPFHLAISVGCSVEVLEYFESLDSSAISTNTEWEQTPLHSSCSGWVKPKLEVLQHLVELDPSALTYRDEYYELPMHSLMQNKSEPSVEALNYLIKAYPDGVKATNIYGDTPLSFLCQNDFSSAVSSHTYVPYENSAYRDVDEHIRRERKRKCQERRLFGVRQEMIAILVKAYPEALHISSENGKTPLSRMEKNHPQTFQMMTALETPEMTHLQRVQQELVEANQTIQDLQEQNDRLARELERANVSSISSGSAL